MRACEREREWGAATERSNTLIIAPSTPSFPTSTIIHPLPGLTVEPAIKKAMVESNWVCFFQIYSGLILNVLTGVFLFFVTLDLFCTMFENKILFYKYKIKFKHRLLHKLGFYTQNQLWAHKIEIYCLKVANNKNNPVIWHSLISFMITECLQGLFYYITSTFTFDAYNIMYFVLQHFVNGAAAISHIKHTITSKNPALNMLFKH